MWERRGLDSSLDTAPRPVTLNTLSVCSMCLKTAPLVAYFVPAAWTFSPGWGCPGRPHSCVLSDAETPTSSEWTWSLWPFTCRSVCACRERVYLCLSSPVILLFYCGKISEQLSGVKHIHIAVAPSPPTIPRISSHLLRYNCYIKCTDFLHV